MEIVKEYFHQSHENLKEELTKLMYEIGDVRESLSPYRFLLTNFKQDFDTENDNEDIRCIGFHLHRELEKLRSIYNKLDILNTRIK